MYVWHILIDYLQHLLTVQQNVLPPGLPENKRLSKYNLQCKYMYSMVKSHYEPIILFIGEITQQTYGIAADVCHSGHRY